MSTVRGGGGRLCDAVRWRLVMSASLMHSSPQLIDCPSRPNASYLDAVEPRINLNSPR